MFWLSMIFLWIWVLIRVFAGIFRSPDLGSWGKALWTLFVISVPLLGVWPTWSPTAAGSSGTRWTRRRRPTQPGNWRDANLHPDHLHGSP